MGIMSLSSPFRPSHRRTRSHTSLSSSPSPAPCNDQWRTSSISKSQPADGPVSPFAVATRGQPPEKWDVDLWRRGKRPRCGPPTSLDSMDLDSCDDVLPGSPDSDPVYPIPSSAPSTPHFPSTSDAFQFRSFKGPNHIVQQQPTAAQSQRLSEPELSNLHSKAFNELRRSVAETGEGFVQRMREFEAQRSRAGSSRTSVVSPSRNAGGFKRGRKRPSASPSRYEIRASLRKAQPIGVDDDSDVEILSTGAMAMGVPSGWNSSKKRAVSLGGLDSLAQPTVAHPASKLMKAAHRERSISPVDPLGSCASDDSSDEDSDDDLLTQSPSCRAQSSRICQQRQGDSATASVTPPLSFTFSSSANSSLSSLPLAPPLAAGAAAFQYASRSATPLSPRRPRRKQSRASGTTPTPSEAKTERAVAALSLALANGAGSVSDYEALRTAQGALGMNDQDQDAGALWD